MTVFDPSAMLSFYNMSQLQTIENYIRNSLLEKDEKYLSVKVAFEQTQEYFKIYDCMESTCHCSVMREIYLKPKNSIINLSLRTHLSEKTLYRYRKKYISYFCYFFNGDVLSEAAIAGK